MTRLKTTAMAALALAIMFAGPAAAQTVPTLAVSAGAPTGVGATVTIQWSSLPGAQGYTLEAGTSPGVANIATVNLLASMGTRVVVFAPNGTYYVRVRGFAGALVGEFSPVHAVTVGGPVTCGPLAAPAVAASNSSYLTVKVDWTPVAGAIGYMVEYSRFNHITELAEPVGPVTNSVTKYAGFPGNFYVRVVAHSACGEVAASAYVPFELTNIGPRTPDPSPGQRLPIPAYGEAVVEAVAARFPGDLHNSCAEHGGNNVFMFRVVQALRQRDSRWGLNWKRGNRGDLSQDIVTYNYGPGSDEDTRNVYIIDIVSQHCGNRPGPAWIDQTPATIAGGGIGRWTLQPYVRAGFPPDGRQ
jgi:hypothetical protein